MCDHDIATNFGVVAGDLILVDSCALVLCCDLFYLLLFLFILEKKYTYDNVRRDANTGKLIYGNKIELDVVNKSKILDILKEDK